MLEKISVLRVTPHNLTEQQIQSIRILSPEYMYKNEEKTTDETEDEYALIKPPAPSNV